MKSRKCVFRLAVGMEREGNIIDPLLASIWFLLHIGFRKLIILTT